jgi:hypothetical protein
MSVLKLLFGIRPDCAIGRRVMGDIGLRDNQSMIVCLS